MPADKSSASIRLPLALLISAVSGVLMTLAMPGLDVPYLGWVAMVPLLVALLTARRHVYLIAMPFSLVFSIGVHTWYPEIFPSVLGYVLIFAVGTFYAGIFHLGIWLTRRLPLALAILALPVAWSGIEFVKFIAPVVENWWFVMIAASQWRFLAALQILTITGFPGLGFLVMLVNLALAALVIRLLNRDRSPETIPPVSASLTALTGAAAVVLWGAGMPKSPAETFKIAVLTDMTNQDPEVLATGEFAGFIVNDPAVSQAIFDVDAGLTRQVAAQNPAFIVWPENEISDIDDPVIIPQVRSLAVETRAYIATDTVWNASTGKHDTALLISPQGTELARRAKINLTDGEARLGFVPGPRDYPVTSTPYGKVGIAVCWDVHRLWIMRDLARAGAEIVLLPMDNDFNATPRFPPFHAANAVFRAVENRMTFGLGTINGVSMVIDPFGRITAEAAINKRSVVLGETFSVSQKTFYTRYGDVFGWLMVVMLALMVVSAMIRGRDTPKGTGQDESGYR